jgi:parvulin-like peptidyl-prolyl isomerase
LAKKNKQPVIKRAPTAGEVAKWQKQKKRNRIVFVFGLVVVIAVLALLGYGYYDSVYQPDHAETNKLHATVVQVNDNKFSLEYIIDVTRFLNLQETNKAASSSDSSAATFPKTYTLDETVQLIENNELLQQAAPGLGISISEDDLQAKIKSIVLPSNAPEDLTEDQYLKYYKAVLKAQHISDEQFRTLITGDMLRPKLQDYLKTQVPKSAEQVHIQGMLVDKDMVIAAADRLVFMADSLPQVAQEVGVKSSSQTLGGDLGWMAKGILGTNFDDAVFKLEPGILSQPIDDENGQYPNSAWLVSVLEKAPDKALDDNQVQSLTAVAYSKWFEQQLQEGLDSKQVVNKLDDALRIWATEYMAKHPITKTSSG